MADPSTVGKSRTGSHALASAKNKGGTQSVAGSRNDVAFSSHALAEGTKSSQAMATFDKDNTAAQSAADGAQSITSAKDNGTLASSGSDGTVGSKVMASSSNNMTLAQAASDQSGSQSLATSDTEDGEELEKNRTGASKGEAAAGSDGATQVETISVNDKGMVATAAAEGKGQSMSQSAHTKDGAVATSETQGAQSDAAADGTGSQTRSQNDGSDKTSKVSSKASNGETLAETMSDSKTSLSSANTDTKEGEDEEDDTAADSEGSSALEGSG